MKATAQDIHPDIDGRVFILKPFKPSPGDFKILLSANEVKKAGVRYPVDKKEVSSILKVLENSPKELMDNSEKAYSIAREKIRSGDIHKIVEVVRDMAKEDNLTFTQEENKLAETACARLTEEIAFSVKIPKNEARSLVEGSLKKQKGGSNGKKK